MFARRGLSAFIDRRKPNDQDNPAETPGFYLTFPM